MADTNSKAEEVINRKHGLSSQHWGHEGFNDDEQLGAHWTSCSRRSRQIGHPTYEDQQQRLETPQNKELKKKSVGEKSLYDPENRPRSKNKRPDVAVYVPRARRTQQSSSNEVSKYEGDNINAEKTSKGGRCKDGIELYVPKHKRLQKGEETKENVQSRAAENLDDHPKHDNSSSVSKPKRKTKPTNLPGDYVASNEKSNPKSSKRKQKHKSKRSLPVESESTSATNQEREEIRVPCDIEVNVETNESADLHSAEISTEIGEAPVSEDTWEDEMKFYDAENKADGDDLNSTTIETNTCVDTTDEYCENPGAAMEEEQEGQQKVGETEKCEPNENEQCHDISSLETPSKQRRTSEENVVTSENDQEYTQLTNSTENLDSEESYSVKNHTSFQNEENSGYNEQSGLQTVETPKSTPTESPDSFENIDNEVTVKLIVEHSDAESNSNLKITAASAATESKNEDSQIVADQSNNCAPQTMETEDSGDTWDSLFTDDGEALDPKLMDELTAAVGKVTVQKTQFDYYNYQPKDPELDGDEYGHLVEIYDFPSDLITRDLLVVFKEYKDRGFDIKWVDDNHAIGIFSSPIAAQAVLGMKHPLMKVRPISQASRQTKVKAKKCGSFMEPYRPRPETTASVARSLVAGALGLKSNLTREQRDAERKKLKEAKEKRKQERQQKKDAWDGSFGKCAMDEQ